MSTLSRTMFNFAIYHKGCLDGFAGFFVAHNSGRLTPDVIVYPDVPSARTAPPDIKGKDVIIIDVAYKKPILEEIIKLANSVVFIDHHVSITDDVKDLKEKYDKISTDKLKIVYDDKRSGATLAWKYFNSRQTAPLFLKYVEDQDTGKWEFENTKPFILALKANYHLSTETKSLNKWFRLLNKENVQGMIEEGKAMEKYLHHLVNINLPRHSMHRFPSKKLLDLMKEGDSDTLPEVGSYKVAVFVGFHCPSVTDLALAAFERIDCDFVMMWVYNLDRKEYVISMRSKDIDVSNIAKAMGGGGHKLAAAFSFSKKQIDIDDIFEGGPLLRNLKPADGDTEAE